MSHPRFLDGRLTTRFIAKGYPDGFACVPADASEAKGFAAGATVVHCLAEGVAVEVGQALATVEAMKMENTLRATRRATVRHTAAEAGVSLAVNELIMEFE